MRRRLVPLMVLLLTATVAIPIRAQVVVTDELTDDLRFREEFGLESDVADVQAIVAAGHSSEDFGIPLTAAEVADLTQRQAREPLTAELQDLLRKTDPTFGGLYIDQSVGGVVDVAFAGESALRDALLAPFVDGLDLRIRQVDYTEAALEELLRVVIDDVEFQKSAGTTVTEADADVRTNRVEVGISPWSEEVAATFEERYGEAVHVYPNGFGSTTVCTSRENCPDAPLRAGLRLWDAGCTTAFLGRYNTMDVILSAGHCANLVPAGHIYQHPNGPAIGGIGTVQKEVYAYDSEADAMVIRIGNAYRSNDIWFSTTGTRPVYSWQSPSQETGGMMVCQSSRISGYACGQLWAIGFAITYDDGIRLQDQRSATYAVASGDSGGPVFSGNRAFGVQSGVNTAGRAIYSHISNVLPWIGMTINL